MLATLAALPQRWFRVSALALAATWAVAVGASCAAWGAEAARARINILFLMADQFRADCLGAEGNRAILYSPDYPRALKETK